MAKQAAEKLRISKEAQKNVLQYVQGLMTAHGNRAEMHAKMEAIDVAYARYQAQTDAECGTAACGNLFREDNIVAPIVVSQVDSLVAYLSEVFLTGSPLFPVVSTPAKRKWAEQLETLMDDHALLGGYARQLLLFLRDGVKYNFAAIEADWDTMDQFQVMQDFSTEGMKLNKTAKSLTKIKRLDPYNLVWDDTVMPGDVAAEGDYAGYLEVLSRTKLKRLINKYTTAKEAYNASEALKESATGQTNYFTIPPQISDYVSARRPNDQVDWDAWFDGADKKNRRSNGAANNYEKFTLYARIIPSDFGIIGPQPNTPQIWKFVVINGKILIHAKRIISAYDRLPILFGQPLEDGLGYQTQSVAETQIPIQEAATTLFNIRFSAARRAISDRALYDPTMINPSDVNSPTPAPKIPVTINPLNKGGLDNAYMQIPYDIRGTETAFQDAAVLVDFSKQLSGLNAPQQGQFQRGNKSVQEWNDTMGGSDGRLRLPALCFEHQVFVWLRFILVLNIFQYGEDAIVVSQKTGEVVDVKLDELRKQVLSFRTADGYTPKSKLASVEMLTQGMTMLMNSPALQQAYGPSLPSMFAHMMQLGGVRGLEEYAPEINQQALGAASPLAQQMPADPMMQGQGMQAPPPAMPQDPALAGGAPIDPMAQGGLV